MIVLPKRKYFMRERSFIHEAESNDTYQYNSKTSQQPKAIQIIRNIYTTDIIVDNI